MQPDASRHPLEWLRKLEVRAPADRGRRVVPVGVVLPVRVLELMLDVEQPDAAHGREIDRGKIDEQHRARSAPRAERDEQRADAEARGPRAQNPTLVARGVTATK